MPWLIFYVGGLASVAYGLWLKFQEDDEDAREREKRMKWYEHQVDELLAARAPKVEVTPEVKK